MMIPGKTLLAMAFAVFTANPFAAWFAIAATPEEAAKLRTELTPFGAERAGNKEGTIPPWDGGYLKIAPGYQAGQLSPDPFADEKPLFQINANNMGQYADKLSEGVQALLQRFPDFRIDVYPTHRTAAAPQWVYDNTVKNATRAKMIRNGLAVEGAYGGIPFPLPKSGYEAMWNHTLAWKGEAVNYDFGTYVVAGAKPVLATGGTVELQNPYYYRDGTLDRFGGVSSLFKLITTAPPFKAGESAVGFDLIDQQKESRKIWQYLVGQRRVRRAPNVLYDTPNFITSGFSFSDETYLFTGALDHYDWTLVGKKELLVPYNSQAFHTKKIEQVLGPRYLNPDHVRWELHRVWVVEAALAPGKRHAMPKRRFYLDEDTWQALLSDGWDARGQLWHTAYALPVLVPELPGVVVFPYVLYDFLKGGYAASSLFNDKQRAYRLVARQSESHFSPATLAAEGIR